MADWNTTNEKIAQEVTGAYKKVEDAVVGAYRKIETGAVDTYKKVEDACVEKLFTRPGETVEQAKARLQAAAHGPEHENEAGSEQAEK